MAWKLVSLQRIHENVKRPLFLPMIVHLGIHLGGAFQPPRPVTNTKPSQGHSANPLCNMPLYLGHRVCLMRQDGRVGWDYTYSTSGST